MVALRAKAIQAFMSRPAQLIFTLWLVAASYLVLAGQATYVGLATAMNLFALILALVTIRVTRPAAAPLIAEGARSRVVVQTLLVLTVILVTFLTTMLPRGVPGWQQMVAFFSRLGERTLPVEWVGGPGNAVANPLQYFVVPLVLLLLLGARPATLGLGKGHNTWRAAVVWMAIPVILWTVLLLAGALPIRVLLRRLIGNALQNGFFEEFLFRGALQTRLNALMPVPWALVAQALTFGLWHVHANTVMFEGDVLTGIAACVVSQTISGIWFGIVFSRTRNLLAPSIQHVFMNTFGQTFG